MFAGIILVVVVVVAAMTIGRRSNEGERPDRARTPGSVTHAQVEAAVTAGILGRDQADALYATAALPPPPRTGPAPLVEALGYVGGLLSLVAGGIVIDQIWDDLATWSRLALLGLGAVVMLVAGISVGEHRGPAGRRLEGFLWLLATAAATGFAAILAADVLGLHDAEVGLVAAGAAAGLSAALWRIGPRPVQQVTTHIALVVAVGTLIDVIGTGADQGAFGITILLLGVTAGVLGARSLVRVPEMELALGIAGALFGAAVTAGQWPGVAPILGLAVATALGAIGIRAREPLCNMGALLGLVIFLPWTLSHYVGDTVALPFLLLLVGLVILGVALALIRRGGQGS